MSEYVIEMLNITKRFPGIVANDNITLQLKRGEIHALLGENGAGKSTLMSVLFGLYQPEEGEIHKDGKKVEIQDPNDANELGIGMVHQHFKLVECFSVLDNIMLGVETTTKGGFLKKDEARKKVVELSEKYGLAVDPDAKIENITVGMQTFLGYARQVLEQAALLEETYKKKAGRKQEFSVSTQHYSFAVNAFVELIERYGSEKYDFCLRETQTYEIIEDVAQMKSEIGILYLNDFNRTVLEKLLKEHDLVFTELFVAKPHIFVSTKNPLAGKKSVTIEELEPYPYLSFEQGEHNSFYFSEEIFSTVDRPKNIRVRDRATLFNLLIGLNGYTVCSGVIDEELNGENIVSVPLQAQGDMHIGMVTHKKVLPSRLGAIYREALVRYTQQKI